MKKIWMLSLIMILGACILCGCGASANVDENTMYVASNGKITDVTVEDFEQDYYDEAELTSYINDAVAAYKADGSDGTVKVKKQQLKDGVVKLVMEYDGYESYAAFNEAKLYAGTILQAQAEGYDFDTSFFTPKQAEEGNTELAVDTVIAEASTENVIEGSLESTETGTEMSVPEEAQTTGVLAQEVLQNDDYKVVILQQNTMVSVKGEIMYVSDHVTVTGKSTARVFGEGAESADAKLAYIIYK